MTFVAVALGFSLLAIHAGGRSGMPPFVNAFQVSIGLLFLSVTAATSLAEERVRGSLDVLMSTTLTTREIVVGKWLGTFRLVPPLAVLPVLVVVGTTGSQVERWPTALLMVTFVLCCGAAITSLGLAMATWCSRLGRAVGLTVSLYTLVTVGWMFGMIAILGGPNPDSRFQMMLSPFFWAGMVTADVTEGPHGGTWGWGILWTLAYALTALCFWPRRWRHSIAVWAGSRATPSGSAGRTAGIDTNARPGPPSSDRTPPACSAQERGTPRASAGIRPSVPKSRCRRPRSGPSRRSPRRRSG